jgi:hypothetical protein
MNEDVALSPEQQGLIIQAIYRAVACGKVEHKERNELKGLLEFLEKSWLQADLKGFY